jgi:hypothetical protein
MKYRHLAALAAALLSRTRVASAETAADCRRGDCEYRFDDEALNDPGWSAYGDYLKIRPPAKRVMLIRPRVSFVPELLKSTNGV